MQHNLSISLFLLLLFSFISCGGSESSKGIINSSTDTETTVFKTFNVLTTGTRPGNLGSTPSEAIANADSLCATDFGAAFKAFLASSVRNPGTDWVLKPNTEYRRSDGTTIIGTTNSSSTFDFPLLNSVATEITQYWSGLDINWNYSANNCGDWTSNIGIGNAGDAGSNDNKLNYSWTVPCPNTSYILCVEQ